MKLSALGLTLCLGVLLMQGCKKNPPVHDSIKRTAGTAQADSLVEAMDLLRHATDVGHYRDALYMLNTHLSKDTGKQVMPLAADVREKLRKLYHLDDEETEVLDTVLFRPIDAYHLQSCYLFRDAARQLEVADSSPLEQARIGFQWVMRRVSLHEQSDEGLPAAFALRRGFGSGLDRALVFLALLRQFQIEGCLLAPSADAAGPILVGALLEEDKKADLHLFDPRLGRPIVGSDHKGIATLSDARAHPELLKASALTPDMIAKLEAYQVSPLEALSARMLFLQEMLLAFQDKVILHQDAAGLDRDLAKAAGRQALVWKAPLHGPSPTRALRLFLSPDDGGIDKQGRHNRFLSEQIPWPGLLVQFQGMRLIQPKDFPEAAREVVLNNVRALFTTFDLQPKEFFLHGDLDAALKRADRMRNVLENEEAAKPLEKADFSKQLSSWRARVNEAYIAMLVRKDANGPAKVEALWTEDQYLLNVLQADSEIPLTRFEKKFLSLILFDVCREPLGQQVNYLVASCLHEKAAQLQANQDVRAAAGKDVTIVKENAGYAWSNARGSWSKYLDRYGLSPQSVPRRLADIQRRWNQGDLPNALYLWEQLHLDMHTTFATRCRLAEAQAHTLKSSPALNDLLADLDNFEKSGLPKQLNECLEKARGAPVVVARLELLARDWAPNGNINWLRESVRERLGKSP